MNPARPPISCEWLAGLAQGYLRDFPRSSFKNSGGLWGYTLQAARPPRGVGFFIGFLVGQTGRSTGLTFPPQELPACIVLAFVRPVSSALHHRLVRQQGSVFRRSFQLLTKYTARRPRFELHEQARSALSRCVPLGLFPPGEEEKYSRNFFAETLALLVRSGLPRHLLARRGR